MADRYDLVLFGATGFTGKLTAQYLARHVPAGCRWALAGRSETKLRAVRADLSGIDPRWSELPLLIADTQQADSLTAIAESARVVISTVGPYLRHGEPLVKACADAGTTYLDLTGEAEFVDRMYVRYHARAHETGARLIHCCGFDSIPPDLGVLFTVDQFDAPTDLAIDGVLRAGGLPSGGTVATAVNVMSRALPARTAAKERQALDGAPHPALQPPRRQDGLWLLPLPTIDAQIVARSARSADYGPNFAYRHYAGVRRLPVAVGSVLGAAAVVTLAQLPPARNLLAAKVTGAGPSAERRAKSWFSLRFTAHSGDRTVVTQVSGGDPGYDETAKMLAEAALCAAFDELPSIGGQEAAGQVTTAAALGRPLIDRLIAAGLKFEVLSDRTG